MKTLLFVIFYGCALAQFTPPPATRAIPTGPCGGDLGGTYPNCTVTGQHFPMPASTTVTFGGAQAFSIIGPNVLAYFNDGSGNTTTIMGTGVSSLQFSNTQDEHNSRVGTGPNGTLISRDKPDANPVLIVQNRNSSSTGDIVQFQDDSGAVKFRVTKPGVVSFGNATDDGSSLNLTGVVPLTVTNVNKFELQVATGTMSASIRDQLWVADNTSSGYAWYTRDGSGIQQFAGGINRNADWCVKCNAPNANSLTLGATIDLIDPNQKATSGQRFACLDTNGKLVSSPSACVGT